MQRYNYFEKKNTFPNLGLTHNSFAFYSYNRSERIIFEALKSILSTASFPRQLAVSASVAARLKSGNISSLLNLL